MSFSLSDKIIYFNHAAVSPWPQPTVEAVKRFSDENGKYGAARYPHWMRVEKELRELAAELINAQSSKSIALVKSTSEALSFVATGLSWRPDDNIVSFDHEFPSNRIPWQSLETQGVELRLVDPYLAEDPEQALFDRCDEQTRLITVSSVQFSNGFRCNLERIGAFCRTNRILFCVDAIQSLGMIPFDVQRCQADFVMADGHKWMMGPEGLGLFYCRPEIMDRLELHQFGWHMVENRGDYTTKNWTVATDATRFECGSPNMLGIHALHASLSHLKTIGIEKIWNRIQDNTHYIHKIINNNKKINLLSNVSNDRLSGIVSFTSNTASNEKLFQHLLDRDVICALRGGGIRFSPHYYNTTDEIDRAFDFVGAV